MILLMLTAQAAVPSPVDDVLALLSLPAPDAGDLGVLAEILLENPGLVLSLVVDCQELCAPAERYEAALSLDAALEVLGVPEAQVIAWPESDRGFDSLAGSWSMGVFVGADW